MPDIATRFGINARRPDAAVSTAALTGIVFASVVYQAVLAVAHTHIFPMSATLVGATEFLIYLACVLILAPRIRLEFVSVLALVLAYLLALSLLRGALELKGFRDAMIPLLFFWLGRYVLNTLFVDKMLKGLIGVVLAVGLFELFFLEQYTRLMDIFSYYVGTGTVTIAANYISDSALNLNGMRPEGIGRTVLPDLLGNHRVSSVFLEPVSLGNFAVIIAAWGLAKSRAEFKQAVFFIVSALILIALSDSRYGLILLGVLGIVRVVSKGQPQRAWITLPLFGLSGVILVGMFFRGEFADNIMGRLFWTGGTLLDFNVGKLMGIDGFDIPYGDMGYAYLFSRWGVLLCAMLWASLWMVQMSDAQGNRFRIFAAIHIVLILAISGTSFFALKTAGLLWFLVGAGARLSEQKTTQARSRSHFATGREVRYAG